MARNDNRMEDIFDETCKHMLARLKSGECTAAELREIRGFLTDNDIKALPAAGSPMGNLVNSLPFPNK